MAPGIKTVALTLIALVAFAANSILTRLAIGSNEIDAATFTCIRLVAGALVLVLIVRLRPGTRAPLRGGNPLQPLALFAYAAPFSFAYVRIGAAVGALVLFGVVQLTMVGYGLFRGERPTALTWLGLALAGAGLAILTVPALARPDPLGLALMAVAGIAWGIYSLAGRASSDPILANARSFLWSSPLGGLIVLLSYASIVTSARGLVLATISGGLTSGLGYAVWYWTLPRLSVVQAAVAQLSVPAIAALGAIALLDEPLSLRFVVSAVSVLGGVGLVLSARSRRA